MCRAHYRRQYDGRPLAGRVPRPLPCAYEGCQNIVRTAKEIPLCKDHKGRKNLRPVPRRNGGQCEFEECDKTARTIGLCPAHYQQVRLGQELRPLKIPSGQYVNNQGYVLLYKPGHPDATKSGWVMEHRYVMAEMIGRSLYRDETVHHINGIRSDNRPENLELWSSSHPCGQRVEDKLAWAREITARYG